MLGWFRRKLQKDSAAENETAEQEVPQPAAEAAPAPDDEAPKTKRRRGTRGGRGRKKPADGAAAPTSPAEQQRTKPKPEADRRPPKPERKPERQRAAPRRRTAPRRPPLPQAKRELLVSVDVGEQRVAVLEDDRVAEVYLERPEKRSIAGNIYKGVVDNVLPGMEAAFVEIGLEKNGFLYVDEIVVPELEGKRHGKKIQDLLSRGQDILVQAVKDPMKTKGARLTTEISLPGRFIVFVPNGEGLGVSRRLEDDERIRLRDILKALSPKEGGVIVRTAAEGASAEDIERDLVFLQRLWKTIQARTKEVEGPALVYQEAELPLRVVRDLFTGDFERALVDHERTYKRITGYLKKTSPHMVERVVRHKEREPLFEAYGVDGEIRSTLSRRVDLPSGGYLVFDYAEAFTVIDVNTGRFVGSRSKTSTARLEDTITKNNLEAVKEVVRQLRLRDIGGIIVIDFIDMANPKNRALVEEALKAELERDRTKTYVVEISPLGLVEMTRQNVTEGPREILTRKCPTCAGDGIVVSDASAAVDAERRLRGLAAGARTQAFRVELNAHVAALLVGPGAARLREIEAQAKRRFFIDAKEGVPFEHFVVAAQGPLAKLAPAAPVAEGDEATVKLVELALHDASAAVGKLDGGYEVCVADAAKLVGRKIRVRIERVLDGTAYATLLDAPAKPMPPITAEGEAEKPTRAPRGGKKPDGTVADVVDAVDDADAPDEDGPTEIAAVASPGDEPSEDAPARKKTRRGSRGGRGRKRKAEGAATEAVNADGDGTGEPATIPASTPTIHLPEPGLGVSSLVAEEAPDTAASDVAADGDDAANVKRKTRRGTRGGRNRKKPNAEATPAAAVEETNGGPPESAMDGAAGAPEVVSAPDDGAARDGESDGDRDWGYVPMSEWEDDFRR